MRLHKIAQTWPPMGVKDYWLTPWGACPRYLPWTFVSCEGHMRGLRKPDQACFQLAIDVTGVAQPSQLVLVDDRQPNVAAAAACGLEAILFKDCKQLRGQLQQLHVL